VEVVIHFPVLPRLKNPLAHPRQKRARKAEIAREPAEAVAEATAIVPIAPKPLPPPPPPVPVVKQYGWYAYRERHPETGKLTLHVVGRFRPPQGYAKNRYMLLEDVCNGRQWGGDNGSGAPVLVLERFMVPPPLISEKSEKPSRLQLTGSATAEATPPNATSADSRDAILEEHASEPTVEIVFQKSELGNELPPLFQSGYNTGRLDSPESAQFYTHVTIMPEGVTMKIKNL